MAKSSEVETGIVSGEAMAASKATFDVGRSKRKRFVAEDMS